MYPKLIYFALVLTTFPTNIRSKGDAGWISNCKAGFNVSSLQCSNGIWLDRDINPGCVCVKGLWVLNTKHCENADLLLFGNGDCFSIEMRIRKITYLGSPFAAFAPATFTSEKNKKWVFQPSEDLSLESNQPVRIIRINPKTHFHYQLPLQSKVCIDNALKIASPTVSSLFSLIFGNQITNRVSVLKFSTSSPFLKFSTENPNQTQCTLQSLASKKHVSFQKFQLTPGQGIYLEAEQVIPSDEKCSKSCQIHRREKRFMSDPAFEVKGYYGFSLSDEKPFTSNIIQSYIKEQNVRIIKSELNYMKNLQSPPELRLNDSTYEFLEMSRVLLNTLCPVPEIPEMLSKAINRLFRYILVERRENNLYGKSDVEESEHAQIMTALETCYNESIAFQFVVKFEAPDCIGPDWNYGTTDQPNGKRYPLREICNCTKVFQGVAYNETVNNTCVDLDKPHKWKYPDRDFLVEAMWKTFQFSHFQCAKYFEAAGRAASAFHERLERFFHADVIFRWLTTDPSSKQLWEFFFMGYNLQQYATAMDMCLCAARYWSEYPQPMVRPVIPVFKKKRSLSFGMDEAYNEIEEESNLNAQCLQHPWDPVQDWNGHSC